MVWTALRSTAAKGFTTIRSERWRNARWLIVGIVIGITATLTVPTIVADGSKLESGDLVILSGRDDSTGGQRQMLISKWNKLNPGSPAKIVELAGDQRSEMVARAQSGNHEGADQVDIYNLDLTWTAEFADNEYILPIAESGLDTSGFLGKPLETCRYNGRLWALPFNSDAGLLYYRTDLVPQPPGTWGQIVDAIDQAFRQPDRDPALVAGYTGQLASYEGLTVNALEAIWAAEGEVVDQDGDVVVDEFAEQVRIGLDRLRPSSRNPPIIRPEFLEHLEDESREAFQKGSVLFMRNWPVAYRHLAQAAEAEGSSGSVPQFGVTRLPGPSALGGQNLAIAAGTTKPRAAQALIEFLTDPLSQQILFERGGFAATRRVVYEDAVIKKTYPYAQDLLAAIENAGLRPVTPYYSQFSEVFRDEVHKALQNNDRLPGNFAERLSDALKGR